MADAIFEVRIGGFGWIGGRSIGKVTRESWLELVRPFVICHKQTNRRSSYIPVEHPLAVCNFLAQD